MRLWVRYLLVTSVTVDRTVRESKRRREEFPAVADGNCKGIVRADRVVTDVALRSGLGTKVVIAISVIRLFTRYIDFEKNYRRSKR